jgi:glycosyltransferase involved in cell wall biosynthesis
MLAGSAAPEEREFAATLRKTAAAAPAGSRVIFAGFVEQVFTWLAACDIFVTPSPREAFGLNTIEAMAAGLPIIGTTGGATPELLTPEQDGLLVSPGDSAALSAALGRLSEQDDLRHRLGQNAQKTFATRYSLEHAANRLLALLPPFTPPAYGARSEDPARAGR